MTVSLYMDHHVPRAITIGLRRRGVNIITAFEDGSHELADNKLLDRATETVDTNKANGILKLIATIAVCLLFQSLMIPFWSLWLFGTPFYLSGMKRFLITLW